MAGMDECVAPMRFPNSKRKAAEAALDADCLSDDGDGAVAVDAAAAPADLLAAAQQQGQGGAEEAPRRPKEVMVMSQEWIDSVLADQIKPLPLKERHLRDPKLAEIFHAHEKSRAKFVEYQDWIRRELETKGYVEVDDDFDERPMESQQNEINRFHFSSTVSRPMESQQNVAGKNSSCITYGGK